MVVRPGREIKLNVEPSGERVTVPTVGVDGGEGQNPPWVYVQWEGWRIRDQLPADGQFRFPLQCSPGDLSSRRRQPDSFRVVLLRRLNEWPVAEMIDRLLEVTEGDDGQWLAMLTSTQGVKERSAKMPVMLVIPLVLVGDSNLGVIEPVGYTNVEVLVEDCRRTGYPVPQVGPPFMAAVPGLRFWTNTGGQVH